MTRLFLLCTSAMFALPIAASAQDPVRLPGQGEVKRDAAPQLKKADRLIPGGGLLLSFDTDQDGRVSDAELMAGIESAFAEADNNADGFLTPLEQISWSESLPTRDASLSNPARFDPNLDRRVSSEEFHTVIVGFAEDVSDEETGEIVLASLKAKRRVRNGDDSAEGEDRPSRRRGPNASSARGAPANGS
ncbi:MAG: hypothetical protein AAF950_08960 [Pseudomonadota bacterium]